METLRGDGNVLIAVDTAGRVLELAQLLDQIWRTKDAGLGVYPLALLNNVSYNVVEFSKSQVSITDFPTWEDLYTIPYIFKMWYCSCSILLVIIVNLLSSCRWSGWVTSSWGVLKTREITRSSSVTWTCATAWQTWLVSPAPRWCYAASQTLSLASPENSSSSGAKMPKTLSSWRTAPHPEPSPATSLTTPERRCWIWRWDQPSAAMKRFWSCLFMQHLPHGELPSLTLKPSWGNGRMCHSIICTVSIFHSSCYDRWGKEWSWKARSWKNSWKRIK